MFQGPRPVVADADRRSVDTDFVSMLHRRYGRWDAQDLLRVAITRLFTGRIAVVSSFGAESAAVLALVAEIDPTTPVIFLDTGKHFADTLGYRDRLQTDLGLRDIRNVGPDPADLARDDADGQLHRTEPDRCCHIRKVLPLARALAPFDAWITGRKRFQGTSRTDLAKLERDGPRIKINPLADWSSDRVAQFAAAKKLPVHPLVGEGYPSIGCAPCTSPVAAGEDARAGRWRGQEKIECGIHRV